MKSNVAIVVSDYYEDISSGLVDGFTNSLDPKFTIDTHNVTGAWEIIHKINSLTDKYDKFVAIGAIIKGCLLYTSPSPRDYAASRMPSSA